MLARDWEGSAEKNSLTYFHQTFPDSMSFLSFARSLGQWWLAHTSLKV
jgi:hypothetical protein